MEMFRSSNFVFCREIVLSLEVSYTKICCLSGVSFIRGSAVASYCVGEFLLTNVLQHIIEHMPKP